MSPNVFHRFPEYGVIHQLIKVLFKVVSGFGSQSSVKVYVLLHPG